jgi:hypothetical protein
MNEEKRKSMKDKLPPEALEHMKAAREEMRKSISQGTYKSPHLKLLNLSPETKSAFETSGFDMYIDTFTDRKTAIASF